MTTDAVNLGGEGMLAARRVSSASFALGMLLAVLGTFAGLSPLFTGVAVSTMIGMLLFAGGVAQTIFAFQSESFGKGAFRFLLGGLTVVAAVAVLGSPSEGLGVLTIILTAYFVASGLADIFFSFKVPDGEGRGWMLFSGIVTLLVAGLIVANWPVSGVWAVGLFVGVRLMVSGMMLMALGVTGKQALTHSQDVRIAALEQQLRKVGQALLQAQVAQAEHAVMLLALDNELRNKVSGSEVDPAIVELNASLGNAREQMQRAAAAASKDWVETQGEANAAFDKLRQNISSISQQVKSELGLNPNKKQPQ